MHRRTLGITVLADFILSEGVDAVLDNVVGRAGATAVARPRSASCARAR